MRNQTNVIALPTAAAEPVEQRRRRGPLPSHVVNSSRYRSRKVFLAQKAAEAERLASGHSQHTLLSFDMTALSALKSDLESLQLIVRGAFYQIDQIVDALARAEVRS